VERAFVYGFRVGHCVRAIAMFAAASALDVWYFTNGTTTLTRVIPGVIGAFFLYMTFVMSLWLWRRKTGRRKIVVGSRGLTAPAKFSSPDVEILYADMREVVASGGEKGRLQIHHKGGTLEIDRLMIGSDGEFDELVGAVRKRTGTGR
jgi:hypothetical protein